MRPLVSLGLVAVLLAAAPGARAAGPDVTDWQASSKSRARLVSDGAGGAAVQIELAPGAITYWREPGDAGVPPVFDFAGSQNLASAQPLFPAPSRIVEADGGEAFGYAGSVVLPIDVKAADPARPVVIALKFDYAVCEKICLPARAAFRLSLPTGAAPEVAALVAGARAAIPQPVEAAAAGVTIAAAGSRAWRLCAPKAPGRDLFLEAPEGYWLTSKPEDVAAGRACFDLALRQTPQNPAFPLALRVTLTGGATALETQLSLAPGG